MSWILQKDSPSLLTHEQYQTCVALLGDGNNQRLCSHLAEAFSLPDYKHDARSSILVDYAAWLCTLCHQLQLDSTQALAVFRIGQQLLGSCAGGAPRSEAQDQLRSLLLQLCTPASTPVGPADKTGDDAVAAEAAAPTVLLPPNLISRLAASFTTTLLQHYNLWVYAFTQQQRHVQHKHHLMVEAAVAPPPLQHALIESDYQAHLAAEEAQRAAEAAAAEAAERAAQEARAAAEAAAAEAAEAAARAEQLQRKPKSLDEAVDKLVALKLEDTRLALAADYAAKATALSARISHMEQQLTQQAAAAAPQGSSHGGSKGSRVTSAKPAAA